MPATLLLRILIICDDSHLALALQVFLKDHGYIVRCESDWVQAGTAAREFRPNAMIAASETMVFVSKQQSANISHLRRPMSTDELLRILESEEEDLMGEASELRMAAAFHGRADQLPLTL
jgi:PleD family two-component response regulator